MTIAAVLPGVPPVIVAGADAAEVRRQAAAAAASAAVALAAAGPNYANTAAGLAATSEGDTFAVDNGDGTVTVYSHEAGPAATELRTIIIDPSASGAAALLGEADGTLQAKLDKVDTGITAAKKYLSLALAVAAAGVGGTLYLQPGVEYELRAGVTSLANQTIHLNGATIKRADQAVTTTTTAITAALTTQVTLTDASDFQVGDQIALAQNGVARSALVSASTLSDIRTITAKVGNQITFNTPLGIGIAAGGTCFMTFFPLTLADGASLKGFGTLDGNRANWTYARWEVTAEILMAQGGANQSVERPRIINAPGEGISVYGTNCTLTSPRFNTIGGNGIHLSGAVGTTIIDAQGTNGNIDTDVGHADGFITFSNGNLRTTILGPKADQWIAGIGAIDNTDGLVIVDDYDFKDMYCCGMFGAAGLYGLRLGKGVIDGVGTNTSKRTGMTNYGGLIFTGLSGSDYDFGSPTVKNVAATHWAFVASGSGTASHNARMSEANFESGKVSITGLIKSDLSFQAAANTNIGSGNTGKIAAQNTIPSAEFATTIAYQLNGSGEYADLDLDLTATGGVYALDIGTTATAYRNVNINLKATGQKTRGASFLAYAGTLAGLKLHVNGRALSTRDNTFVGVEYRNDGGLVTGSYEKDDATANATIAFNMNAADQSKTILRSPYVTGVWYHPVRVTDNSNVNVRSPELQTTGVKNAANAAPSGVNVVDELVFT